MGKPVPNSVLTIEPYSAKDGWRWRAKRGGRIVVDGAEAYTRPADAMRACRRFALAILESQFVVRKPR